MGRGAASLQTSPPVFLILPSAWQSRGRMWEDACIAYPRLGRIKGSYMGSKIQGVRVAKVRFRQKRHSTGCFGSTSNAVVGIKSSIQEKSQFRGSADRLNALCVVTGVCNRLGGVPNGLSAKSLT